MDTNGIEMNEAPGSTRRECEVAREALRASWFNVPGQEAMTEVVLQGTRVARKGTDDEHAREREEKSGENPRRHQAHE